MFFLIIFIFIFSFSFSFHLLIMLFCLVFLGLKATTFGSPPKRLKAFSPQLLKQTSSWSSNHATPRCNSINHRYLAIYKKAKCLNANCHLAIFQTDNLTMKRKCRALQHSRAHEVGKAKTKTNQTGKEVQK